MSKVEVDVLGAGRFSNGGVESPEMLPDGEKRL